MNVAANAASRRDGRWFENKKQKGPVPSGIRASRV
jgi:hypothetical protein